MFVDDQKWISEYTLVNTIQKHKLTDEGQMTANLIGKQSK